MNHFLEKKPTPSGLALIQSFESFQAEAYPDPLHGWSVPSIGYGTTVYQNGQRVTQGDVISLEQAEKELQAYIVHHVHPGLLRIPYIHDMNEAMIGALESFAYNLGPHFYGGAHFDTITQKLRDKEWNSLRAALLLYVNPGTAVTAGLRRRRNAEADLWEQGLKSNYDKSDGL